MLHDTDQHWRGALLIVGSAVAFSLAGLFTRLIALDVWTILFWRGLFGGLFIAGYILYRHSRETFAVFRGIGRAGLLVAACSTLATICFINALRLTTVADVMVINATTPFLTAAIAWLATAQRESRTTLAASAVALAGVAVMFDVAASSGHLVGNVLALVMTILISVMMVIIRHHRETPMLPAACLSAFGVAVAVAPMATPGAGLGVDLGYLVLFGTAQFGLGLLLLTLGTRLISATQSALIGALETPLAPLWVWLAFGEIASPMTFVGGAIVMAAVIADLLLHDRSGDGRAAGAALTRAAAPCASRPRQVARSSVANRKLHW